MKRLISGLLFIILTPCIAQQVSDYYPPPNIGDYWIHHAETFMGENNPYTTVEEVEGIDIINEQEYFRYKVSATEDIDGSHLMLFYTWINENGEGIAMGNNPDIDSADIFDSPIEMFPSDLSIGETWEMELHGSDQKRIYFLESFSESVEVPAGNFENCLKFIVTVEDNFGDTLATEDYYYAQNVGRVLIVSDLMGTSELTEYSVGVSPLYVGTGEEYTTINDAVDAANEGNLIIVKNGSYAVIRAT